MHKDVSLREQNMASVGEIPFKAFEAPSAWKASLLFEGAHVRNAVTSIFIYFKFSQNACCLFNLKYVLSYICIWKKDRIHHKMLWSDNYRPPTKVGGVVNGSRSHLGLRVRYTRGQVYQCGVGWVYTRVGQVYQGWGQVYQGWVWPITFETAKCILCIIFCYKIEIKICKKHFLFVIHFEMCSQYNTEFYMV